MQLDELQKLFFEAKIKWSNHCLERMGERDISRKDIKNCITKGEIIENYPNDFPHPSCLIFGYTIDKKALHVVVGSDGEYVYIITAYLPDIIKFEKDLKTRRK